MQCLAYLPLIHILLLFMYFLSLAGHFDSIVLPGVFFVWFSFFTGLNEVSLFIHYRVFHWFIWFSKLALPKKIHRSRPW